MSIIPGNEVTLSIIIVNYNLATEIENCLISFFKKADNIEYEIIIVDNNSADKNLLDVEKKFKSNNVQFYYLDKNVGFGQGCNYGFSKATGKYICFLNPDTIIKEDIFLPIINFFNTQKSVGIVGPKQYVKNIFFDLSAGFYPNIFFELIHMLGIGVFFEGFITYLLTKFKRGKCFEVDWILGAAIFMRAEVFRMVNGFDKDYFMFSEEVDLCKRVSNLGLKIIYCPRLYLHHLGSISGKKNYSMYTIRTYSSRNIFISKHYPSFKKYLMRSLLRLELISQIIIWTVLLVVNKQKSKQKLSAFFYLLKNNLKYEHRD